jgi:hypothetical protein
MSCPPTQPTGPLLSADPCQRLAQFEEALFALATGAKRAQIRQGENWVQYHQGSVPYLEREVARLRAICGKRSAITLNSDLSGRMIWRAK